jgi:hypothetical protein
MLFTSKGYLFEELTSLIMVSQAFIGVFFFGIIGVGLGVYTKERDITNDEIIDKIMHPKEHILRWVIAYLVSYIFIDVVCLAFIQKTEKVIIFWSYFSGIITALFLFCILYQNKMAHYVTWALLVEILMECSGKIYNNLIATKKIAETEAIAKTILILLTGIWGIYTIYWIMKKCITHENHLMMDIFLEKLEILNLLRLRNILNEEEFELQKIRLIKRI